MKIDGGLASQTIDFVSRAQNDPKWAQDSLMKFIMFQIERARRGEIAESTINNYYKATKLLCEMNDIQLSWNRFDGYYRFDGCRGLDGYLKSTDLDPNDKSDQVE